MRKHTLLHPKTTVLFLLLFCSAIHLPGCERSPEDLEQWRGAEGGMEKLQGWAKSSKEPMPVRTRAIQILVEEDEAPKLQQMLDKMSDTQERQQLVSAATTTIESMWAAADYPKMDEKLKSGERVKIAPSKSVKAKDAAYLLYPYASEQDQAKLGAIIAQWLSQDHELRNQLGRAKLAQMLPYGGPKGFEGMMAWFGTMEEPGTLARDIRRTSDDATKAAFAKFVLDRAQKDHPNLSDQMRVIVLETEDEQILPYLERAIKDPQSPPKLVDDAMDAYVRLRGAKATPLLQELIADQGGLMRSVAFTRLIEVRGKDGVTQGINALPLEIEKYPTEGEYTLDSEVDYYCNIVQTELKKQKIDDVKPVITSMLKSPRWPARLIATHCVKSLGLTDLTPQLEPLKADPTPIPGWGSEQTVGGYATEIAGG